MVFSLTIHPVIILILLDKLKLQLNVFSTPETEQFCVSRKYATTIPPVNYFCS